MYYKTAQTIILLGVLFFLLSIAFYFVAESGHVSPRTKQVSQIVCGWSFAIVILAVVGLFINGFFIIWAK